MRPINKVLLLEFSVAISNAIASYIGGGPTMRFHTVICLLSLLPATSYAQSVGGIPDAAATPQSPLTMADKNFIDQAAIAGLAEVQNGNLASTKGDAQVKKIGFMMVADHTAMNDKLQTIAQANDVTPPTTLSPADQKIASALGTKQGTAFDSDYLAEEKQAHVKAIALFKQEAASGQNPALKTFAQTSLPVLAHHLAVLENAAPS
jgi:putative membrane protein